MSISLVIVTCGVCFVVLIKLCFIRSHYITVRASELDLLTFIAGRCLWSAFVFSGSSFGGGCRVSLFVFLPWVMLFGCFAWASFMSSFQLAFFSACS